MKNKRQKIRALKNAMIKQAKKISEARQQYSRQLDYDDQFDKMYEGAGAARVLRPPYLPGRMYELYEESGVLTACVEAMCQNIHGYGFNILPIDRIEGDDDIDSAQKQKASGLFYEPNPEEGFVEMAKRIRRDREVTGNGFMEVVRNLKGEPVLLFWADACRVRITPKDEEVVNTTIEVYRNGNIETFPIQKRFRKFVMMYGTELRFYKEFGDPRIINCYDGKSYQKIPNLDDRGMIVGTDKPFAEATEILHFKHGSGVYGVPPWIGTVLAVMGISKAEYINYDLFDGQGIPPMIVSVSGGTLTEESMDDLVYMFERAKGSENFHKIMLLEAESTTGGIEGKESNPKLEVKPMTESRKEDAMFLSYLKDARETIRQQGFRLPALFIGATDHYNYATAKIARETAEEQVFIPERVAFDDMLSRKLLRSMGIYDYKFVSKAPTITGSEEIVKLLPHMIASGVFTINELIKYANENFGMEIKPYEDEEDKEWANEPIPFVLNKMSGTMVADVRSEDAISEEESADGKEQPDEKVSKMYHSLVELQGVARKFAESREEQHVRSV